MFLQSNFQVSNFILFLCPNKTLSISNLLLDNFDDFISFTLDFAMFWLIHYKFQKTCHFYHWCWLFQNKKFDFCWFFCRKWNLLLDLQNIWLFYPAGKWHNLEFNMARKVENSSFYSILQVVKQIILKLLQYFSLIKILLFQKLVSWMVHYMVKVPKPNHL
jgi:hypothetical protein